MAHTLSITDGTTTLQLNDLTTVMTVSYPMRSPEVNASTLSASEDGPPLASPVWSNVTETISLLIRGANPAAVRTTLQTLEQLMDRARQRAVGWGRARTYLQAQLASEADTWRSEILAGQVVVTDPLGDVWKNSLEVELVITRRHFWEGPETALHMSSVATAETTDPVVWHNGADNVSGERNYAHIAANRVTGVLPTPLKLKLVLTGSTQDGLSNIWIGNTVWMDPANLDPILLGSQAAGGASHSWATDAWTTTHSWTIPTATQTDFAGQMVRPLVAWSTRPNAATVQRGQVTITLGGIAFVVWQNDLIQEGPGAVRDYGPMPLPPAGLAGVGSTLAVRLQMRRTGGDNVTAHSLHLMPSGHGVLRHLQMTGFNFGTGVAFVDDGIEDTITALDGTDAYAIVRAYHAPVHVWPGRINRLRMLVSKTVWAAGVGWTAQAWFRPRRLTV